MPCYLFTYHGYGTWLPDHPRGYVRRKVGIVAADENMAGYYRNNQAQQQVAFDRQAQNILISAANEAFRYQQLQGHAVATERSHIHILVGWTTDRHWQVVRRQLRSSLTRRLNQEVENRIWFSKQPSRKQVHERQHFDYLMQTYLPKHRGLKWSEDKGLYE